MPNFFAIMLNYAYGSSQINRRTIGLFLLISIHPLSMAFNKYTGGCFLGLSRVVKDQF